jgi:Arc/MetJ-type ribon-helix-helix transcriptional regulator
MRTYTIHLPDEFAAFVDQAVAEKKFDSVDHLFLYAVVSVADEVRQDDAVDKEWLRKEIQKGLDSSARGEVAPLDMARLRAKLEATKAR